MREIKFRAWCVPEKQMYDVFTIEFCQGGIRVEGTGIHIGNGWATEANGHKHDCDVVLMQYTGLTDKNGVEIYEGDVVYFSYGIPGRSVRGEIQFKDASFFVLTPSETQKECWLGELNFHVGEYEVIGNVFENPELLGEDNASESN